MTQTNAIGLKITFPELDKEHLLFFPRNCTVLQMYDIISRAGVVTDLKFLNLLRTAQCYFFIPWSGIWMQKDRILESYALCDEEPLEVWEKPHFPDNVLTVFIPDLNVKELVPFFPKFTTGRGAIQSLAAKDQLNIELYGLFDPAQNLWLEINETLSNYGFETGGYVEYIKYSPEEAEARRQQFLKSKEVSLPSLVPNPDSDFLKQPISTSPRQATQPQLQPQSPYQSTQPQLSSPYQSTQPQTSPSNTFQNLQSSTITLQVKAPFFSAPAAIPFSTSDYALNVLSRIKWAANLQNDTTGYDIIIHYKDGSTNVMDEFSPLYFYETNIGGNSYTAIELVPNNKTIPPPASPQPLDTKMSPSADNQATGNEISKGMTAMAIGMNTTSAGGTIPSGNNIGFSQSATVLASTSSSSLDFGSIKKTTSASSLTLTNKSPSLASLPVDSITIRVEIPAVDQAKSIKVSWNETPAQIIQTLKSKKWLPIELSAGYCLCIPGNEKAKPKLKPIMLEPNQPLSVHRDRIKPLETILLVTEEEGKKMLTKKGYTPTGALSKPQKDKKSFLLYKFRKSDTNQKRDEKKRAGDTIPATIAAPNIAAKSTSATVTAPPKEAPQTTVTYRYEVLKKLVEALEERGTKEEGIFRVSGSTETTNQVHSTLNDVPDVSKVRVHDIASILRKYLRDLPDPLIPASKYDLFLETQKPPTSEEKNKALKSALGTLPEENKSGLKLLMRLLKKIADNSDITKMTASNLAMIFGPALLRTKGDQSSLMQSPQIPTNIVNSLIVNYNFFFEAPASESSSILRIDLLKSSDLLDLAGANFSPKQDLNQNNTVANSDGASDNYEQVIATLLSPTTTNDVKFQNVAKLSNFFQSENEQLKQYIRNKVGMENAIKLVETLAFLCTTKRE
jgi:hypothetical protein